MGKITSGDIDKYIGQQLRKARKQKGYSLDKTGELLDVSQQQVSRYELGQQKLSAAQLFLLAKGFDVPVAYFFQDISLDALPQKDLLPMGVAEEKGWYSATQVEQEELLLRSFRLLPSHEQKEALVSLLNTFIER